MSAILKAALVEFYKIFLCVYGALRDEIAEHTGNRLASQWVTEKLAVNSYL